MQHYNFNIMNRRSFLGTASKAGIAAALAAITNVPPFLKRAMAEGTIGSGKKVLFVWLRFGNDSLNSIIPILDSAYNNTNRQTLMIPKDPAGNSAYSGTGTAYFPAAGAGSTYGTYPYAITLGNGWAGLHPSLKFLAPVYNSGDLALIHRVAYPKQSRSHFDSQNYWENGNPNNNLSKDGIFYRTIIESGLAGNGVTGVSIQSALPLILRGSDAAMTNLTDPQRYDLLGIPSITGDPKAMTAIASANTYGYAPKKNRDLLFHQYDNLQQTLNAFGAINFTEAGNTFQDDVKTDSDNAWVPINNQGQSIGDPTKGYFLFPTNDDKNGGWGGSASTVDGNKFAVSRNHESFFYNLKAAALVLMKTSAIIAGTEIGGFDTHQNQGTLTGTHPDLQRAIGWALYGLRKFFMLYGLGGSSQLPGATVGWNDVVVVTLSEFGRTTVENTDAGTDHAEAGAMVVAGGNVKGYGRSASGSGVFNCNPNEPIANSLKWVDGQSGSMFGASGRYLSRNTDYRSVLGEIIREHLGATQNQLNRIIPGYAVSNEYLLGGNTSGSGIDGVPIRGELNII